MQTGAGTGGEPTGRVALVTGAASGLGAAIAEMLGQRGMRVAIGDLAGRADEMEGVATGIRAGGGEATAVPLDVREPATIREAVARVVARFGRLDVAVCNAGVNVRKPALEVTEEDWDRVLDVNLRGVFFTAQAAAARMVRQGGGKIVSIASIWGFGGSPTRAAYCASKAGVVNLTRALAVEWATENIQVNAVAPTYVRTPLTRTLFADEAFLAETLARTPNGRLATTEEVAEAVAFLASPAAGMITGVTLPVDGGWTAQ